MDKKLWLITGGSSGFGEAIYKAALEKGDRICITLRAEHQVKAFNEKYQDNPDAMAVLIDVTNTDQIQVAVQEILEKFGRIDYLVNNAGYGVLGTIEETSHEDVVKQFQTNVYGVINMIKAVLPSMRMNKSGWIINISSSVGLRGRPGFGIYSASKFALEGLTDALRDEVMELGINVTAVQPGAFKTKFFEKSNFEDMNTDISDYEKLHVSLKESYSNILKSETIGDPDKLADAIVNHLVDANHAPRYFLLKEGTIRAAEEMIADLTEDIEVWRELSTNMQYEKS